MLKIHLLANELKTNLNININVTFMTYMLHAEFTILYDVLEPVHTRTTESWRIKMLKCKKPKATLLSLIPTI